MECRTGPARKIDHATSVQRTRALENPLPVLLRQILMFRARASMCIGMHAESPLLQDVERPKQAPKLLLCISLIQFLQCIDFWRWNVIYGRYSSRLQILQQLLTWWQPMQHLKGKMPPGLAIGRAGPIKHWPQSLLAVSWNLRVFVDEFLNKEFTGVFLGEKLCETIDLSFKHCPHVIVGCKGCFTIRHHMVHHVI